MAADLLPDGLEVSKTNTNPTLPDSNGDGVSDFDEDRDRDGFSNGVEVNDLLTDPADARSTLLPDVSNSSDGLSLKFQTARGRSYQVLYTDDPGDSNSWVEVVLLPGNGAEVVVPLPAGEFSERGFFRIALVR